MQVGRFSQQQDTHTKQRLTYLNVTNIPRPVFKPTKINMSAVVTKRIFSWKRLGNSRFVNSSFTTKALKPHLTECPSLQGCYAISTGEHLHAFRKSALPPSSGFHSPKRSLSLKGVWTLNKQKWFFGFCSQGLSRRTPYVTGALTTCLLWLLPGFW